MRGRRLSLLESSIGKKIAAAVSGAILLVFLLLHMVGNLKAFGHAEEEGGRVAWAIDQYAHFLRSAGDPLLPAGALLWTVRLVLLSALVIHVWLVVDLASRNRAASASRYARRDYAKASPAARSMMWTGSAVLVFVVLHLLHFTTGSFASAAWDPSEVHAHLAQAFRQPWLAGLYLVALLVVLLHLQHGAWSAFQTLGWNDANRDGRLRVLATGFAVLVVLGFASVPVAFLFGWLPRFATIGLEGAP